MAKVKLKNNKVVVINGLARGGTNIVWNILQSHPAVCSPIYETGEILYPKEPKKLNELIKQILRNGHILAPLLLSIIGYIIDKRFYNFKLRNLTHPDNLFKFEGVLYTRDEIENSVLCLKSVNRDIELTELLSCIYEECFFVGLIRNGYALCEGWVRRGWRPVNVGYTYRKYGEKMIEDSERYQRYTIVKLEDILKNLFAEASRLYEFVELEPTSIDKLRLKSKRVLSKKGQHETSFGEVDRKYWFSPQDIHQIIIPDISDIQARAISSSDIRAFEREAKPILDYFGYTT